MVVAVAANEAVRLRLLVLELELEFECVLDMNNKVWLHMPTSRLVHAVDLRFSDPSETLNRIHFAPANALQRINRFMYRLDRDVGPSRSRLQRRP